MSLSDENPGNVTSKLAARAFWKCWLSPYFKPKVIWGDEDGALTGWGFAEVCDQLDIKIDPIAGEAPWQMGRHSKHLKVLEEMTLDFLKEDDTWDMEEAAELA